MEGELTEKKRVAARNRLPYLPRFPWSNCLDPHPLHQKQYPEMTMADFDGSFLVDFSGKS